MIGRSFPALMALGAVGASCTLVLTGCRSGAAPERAARNMVGYDEVAATPAPPADHRVAYGPAPLQFGELRLPRGGTRAPVVVLVHGGCWQSAYDLRHVSAAAASLANAGFAVWTPEYARVGDEGGGWPGTFVDVARAIDHVRELARVHAALDTTRVVLMGHSAGGHLALWAASRRPGETVGGQAVARAPLRVAGVVSLAGITDLAAYAPSRCGSAIVPLLGGTAAEFPDRFRTLSPASRIPLGVAVHAVHGGADAIVPTAQSAGLVAAMRAAGERAELTVVPGAGHFDLIAPQAAAWSAVLAAARGLAGPR